MCLSESSATQLFMSAGAAPCASGRSSQTRDGLRGGDAHPSVTHRAILNLIVCLASPQLPSQRICVCTYTHCIYLLILAVRVCICMYIHTHTHTRVCVCVWMYNKMA